MARRFVARIVHGDVNKGDLAFIDEMTRYNPQIPADAQMVWDEENRCMWWVWDDGLPAEKDEEER